MMTPKDRYLTDPIFHRLVDMMYAFMDENACRQWTPTELREAVILAACMYEMNHVRPLILDKKNFEGG